jgi:hypothetical protein
MTGLKFREPGGVTIVIFLCFSDLAIQQFSGYARAGG